MYGNELEGYCVGGKPGGRIGRGCRGTGSCTGNRLICFWRRCRDNLAPNYQAIAGKFERREGVLASSVDTGSRNQRTSLEGRLVRRTEVDNLVDHFLGNLSWIALCHARYRRSWAVKREGGWCRDGELGAVAGLRSRRVAKPAAILYRKRARHLHSSSLLLVRIYVSDRFSLFYVRLTDTVRGITS